MTSPRLCYSFNRSHLSLDEEKTLFTLIIKCRIFDSSKRSVYLKRELNDKVKLMRRTFIDNLCLIVKYITIKYNSKKICFGSKLIFKDYDFCILKKVTVDQFP